MEKQPILKTENLSKTFEVKSSRVPVLKDVNVSIEEGEFVVITGPSGCGKSTLLHILLGLEAPTTGRIFCLTKTFISTYLKMKERIYVKKTGGDDLSAQPNWIKALTVLENVMFALRINSESDDAARRKSQEMLSMVGMLDWAEYIPTELSSGQQQKVALARQW
jgi:putative ABC transport system ATP-binding protein